MTSSVVHAPSRADIAALDGDDPLAAFRDRFVVGDATLVYLDGNSLGRLPVATRDRLREVVEAEWGQGLIGSWESRWMDLPRHVGDLIGIGLLAAATGEVIVAESTTIALYKTVSAALDARPGRDVVVIERSNFPTDRYVVESLAAQRGLEIRWLDATGAEGVSAAQLEQALDDRVAVTVLSHVDYRSAALLDLPALTAAAHACGALTVWDLCHSVGVVPIDLTRDQADLAVGCTYKYLNGGPGAPAFIYVATRLAPHLRQPVWGWWSRADMFEMAEGYQPQPDIRSWLSGSPPILSLAAVEPGVKMVAAAGVDRIRAKSQALTALAVQLYDAWLAPGGFGLATSRDPSRRGSHVTVTHPRAAALSQELVEAGVVPDFRHPDGIRLGLAPLTTRFLDVFEGLATLRDLA